MLRPSSKRLLPITHQSFFSSKKNKKKSNSQYKYFQPPDIIAQVKPSYLNNFIQPMNPHKSSFTPTNHSSIYQEDTFLLPQKSPEFTDKKTLILDLDETLVHSSFTPFEKNDIVLNVDFDGIMYNIYVLVRPGAKNFIKNISKYFEVVTFTASLSNYASPLLDLLDSEHNIKYRLYREHCTFLNGIYIKDLKRLNRNLKDLIIVDNSPLAYAFHSENGLPIKTWYDDPNDIELIKISKLLEFLSKAKDVRNYIKKFVKDNDINYDEAMNIIENFEIKNKNKIKKNNNKLHNNNSFISKTNISINNNENNEYHFNSNTTNVNTANKINLIREFINLSNNPINMCSLSSKGESTKNQNQNDDSKRNRIKYKPNHDKINKNKKISLNDIAVMNNIIKKQNDNFETGKMSQKLLLIKNVKQKQKANNTFRLGQKNDIKNNSNLNNNNNNINNINSGFYNSKYNLLIPIGLPSSNTTKNLFYHQDLFYNNINNSNSNKHHGKGKIHNKSSNINNSIEKREIIKNNYLNMLQDKKQNNKKNKYTNLLNQFGNEGIKSYYQDIMEKNKILFNNERLGFEKATKSPNLRISSSISSHRNYSSIGKNKNLDKNFVSFHMPRSRSTGNFLKIGKQGKLSPKTPNRHMAFKQNDGENKLLSLFGGGGINFDDIARYKNNQNIGIGKNNGEFKFKRCQSSKKFK